MYSNLNQFIWVLTESITQLVNYYLLIQLSKSLLKIQPIFFHLNLMNKSLYSSNMDKRIQVLPLAPEILEFLDLEENLLLIKNLHMIKNLDLDYLLLVRKLRLDMTNILLVNKLLMRPNLRPYLLPLPVLELNNIIYNFFKNYHLNFLFNKIFNL